MAIRVSFIGLGQVGGKLAGSLAQSDAADLTVFDLSAEACTELDGKGARVAASVVEAASTAEVFITCLPSPAATSAVMDGPNGDDGALHVLPKGAIWLEMSTNDADEVKRLSARAEPLGIRVMDCPVSGGCHRADTGNIAIFAGGSREDFDSVLPLLTEMGREILHTGELGSASVLKVMTNYLATANLLAVSEAMTVMAGHGIDLATTYDAISVSSGNSFVHETEGQVILNGSRDVGFTIQLVRKDIGLFQKLAEERSIPLDLSPLLNTVFDAAQETYGPDEWSTNIIRRYEDASGLSVQADGFPAELTDNEPRVRGAEVPPRANKQEREKGFTR
jgi:3-hydroxyisobutyrate dehydrogenase